MKRVIFYSWQSDLPNPTNRGFIELALKNAATIISNDQAISVEPVVDRDTQGVSGSPDIASTIFSKITAADVFVADVSIVAHPTKARPTPNPNVLIELGYALRCLGHERVILVFNNSFGKIGELPFDLKMRRLMTYSMSFKEQDRASERLKLEKQLEAAIRSALEQVPKEENPKTIPAVTAVENNQPNKVIVIRENLVNLLKKIDKVQPKKYSEGGTVDNLIAGIDSTQELVAEFSKIVEITSIMNDQGMAIEIYKWFGNIFERYEYPPDKNGPTSNADHDYFKFMGHEMFVTMIALYIREGRWNIIENVLSQPIPVKYLKYEHGPSNVYWDYASQHLPLLLDESRNKRRLSIHADILNKRHSSGVLSAAMPIEEFCASDFFLFLLGELPEAEYSNGFFKWRPWSILYMKYVPMFIKDAAQKQSAQKLANIFDVPNIDEFKERLRKRYGTANKLFTGGFWDIPDLNVDIDKIATR